MNQKEANRKADAIWEAIQDRVEAATEEWLFEEYLVRTKDMPVEDREKIASALRDMGFVIEV